MLTPFALFFGLTVATAIIAYWSDNLGKKLGKKRVSLFGLRPRTTATVLTVASSWAIMLFTLATLLIVVEPLRSALFQFDRQRVLFRAEQRKNGKLQNSTRDLQAQTRNLQASTQLAQNQARFANSQTKNAQTKTKIANSQTKTAQNQTKTAQNQARIARNNARLAQNQVKTARNQIKSAQFQTRNARNQAKLAQNQANFAQNQVKNAVFNLKNADFRLKTAKDRLKNTEKRVREVDFNLKQADFRLKTANARLKTADFRLKTATFRLKTANSRLKTTQDNLKTTDKQLFIASREAFKAGSEALEAERQVAQAKQSIAEATLVVETLLSQRDQLVAQNNTLAIEDLRVSIGQTFAARTLAVGKSQAQIEEDLRALLVESQRALRGNPDKNIPALVPEAVVRLERLQLSDGSEQTVLEENQIVQQLARLLAQSREPASVRAVADRNYTARETEIGARFVVVPLRQVFRRGDVLGEISVDGSTSNARIFSALSTRLIEIGRQTATQKGVNPPQSPDEPTFYANGTNEALFEALSLVKAQNKTVRVRLVAAQDLTTVEPLRVRFEVAAPGVRA